MLAKLDVDGVDRGRQHAQQQLPGARRRPCVIIGDREHGRTPVSFVARRAVWKKRGDEGRQNKASNDEKRVSKSSKERGRRRGTVERTYCDSIPHCSGGIASRRAEETRHREERQTTAQLNEKKMNEF